MVLKRGAGHVVEADDLSRPICTCLLKGECRCLVKGSKLPQQLNEGYPATRPKAPLHQSMSCVIDSSTFDSTKSSPGEVMTCHDMSHDLSST